MKFKEFTNWCNERACDGCWGMLEAIACINLINEIMKIQFWKREKIWKENYEQQVLEEIINPIEKKLEEMKKMKKIINGKKYDTDTAEQIGYDNNGLLCSDLSYIEETLYKKKTGEFFYVQKILH